MKTTIKILVCLLFLGTASTAFSQQPASTPKPAAKKSKKQTSKKDAKAVDNKIAVSDQAQPEDKGKKKQAPKKEKGISNK